MGAYYVAIDFSADEILEPRGNIEWPGVIQSTFSGVVMLANYRGCKFELISDHNDIPVSEYKNVSEKWYSEYDKELKHDI